MSGQLAWPISSGPRTNPHNWVFFIKKPTLEADDMSPILFVLKKKSDDALFVLSRFQSLWWLENQAQDSFNPKTYFLTYFFFTKNTCKHLKNQDKPIYSLEKPQRNTQKSNSTQNQKSTRVQICFFTNFQGTKTLNMNSPYQMEQFNTNIVYFGALN